ncbi:unnamed protein product, partial [Prorocentrum cordatum]
ATTTATAPAAKKTTTTTTRARAGGPSGHRAFQSLAESDGRVQSQSDPDFRRGRVRKCNRSHRDGSRALSRACPVQTTPHCPTAARPPGRPRAVGPPSRSLRALAHLAALLLQPALLFFFHFHRNIERAFLYGLDLCAIAAGCPRGSPSGAARLAQGPEPAA